MKFSDSFNPRFEACGFHPEEIVGRRRDLSEGGKRLYDDLKIGSAVRYKPEDLVAWLETRPRGGEQHPLQGRNG